MKIFCIGLNKTGTNSLHQAFKTLGLKSVHFRDDSGRNIKDIILRNHLEDRNILAGLEDYDAISDWDRSHTVEIFKKFDAHWPGSKFILHFRDVNEWLESREQHIKRQKSPSWRVDKAAWKKHYNLHYGAALQYFAGRKDMLLMDITKGDGWEKLCPFLGIPVPSVPFPHIRP